MSNELFKRILSSIAISCISFFFITKGSFYFIFFISVTFLIAAYEWNNFKLSIFYKLLGSVFLIISFFSFYKIRVYDKEGLYLTFFVLTICIATDIGGYIFGRIIKGPKLISISPNKTYSGLFGAFICSLFASFLYLTIFNFNVFNEVLIVIFISSISQAGDILISYFKRISKIKDSGNLIPGHGGLLDRIDGMIFVFPCIYLIFNI